MTNKRYKIIYADPPWQFASKQYQDGGRQFLPLSSKYQTMRIDDIKQLPVESITDQDAVCFLWVCDAFLKEGIEVLESWGFTYKTIAFNWIKQYASGAFCFNPAPYTLKSWEICLLGTKGKTRQFKNDDSVKGLIISLRSTHSKKPDEIRYRIEQLFGDLPRIELFSRNKVDGWDAWGNEVESDILLIG